MAAENTTYADLKLESLDRRWRERYLATATVLISLFKGRRAADARPMREGNCQWGRRKSTVAIRTRYLSLDFFPVVNAPPHPPTSALLPSGGLTVCTQGKAERRGGSRDTMRSLSLPHGCPSPPARKYQHSDLHLRRRQTPNATVVLQSTKLAVKALPFELRAQKPTFH